MSGRCQRFKTWVGIGAVLNGIWCVVTQQVDAAPGTPRKPTGIVIRFCADAAPNNATFRHLAQFLNVKQEWIEALAEQRPPFVMLDKNSPRRAEIAFYTRLPEALRARLDRGEKVAYSEFPKEIRQEIQTVTKARWKGITTGQVSKLVYRLTTDPQGWQRWQTLNLPHQRPAPKKGRSTS